MRFSTGWFNGKNEKSVMQYNSEVYRLKGKGLWRSLYLQFLVQLEVRTVMEVGAGSPEFLDAVESQCKFALEGREDARASFEAVGIDFFQIDLDNDAYPDLPPIDAVICSDVFEHLLKPGRTLEFIRNSLSDEGVLFSHVPNEFALKQTLSVMLGKSDSMYFHKHCDEYCDPHLHRFTKFGFLRFLEREFTHNLFISDLKYSGWVKLFLRMGMKFPVPYCLEGGPTFISTQSSAMMERLKQIKARV